MIKPTRIKQTNREKKTQKNARILINNYDGIRIQWNAYYAREKNQKKKSTI